MERMKLFMSRIALNIKTHIIIFLVKERQLCPYAFNLRLLRYFSSKGI
jgi:hypothetical protein